MRLLSDHIKVFGGVLNHWVCHASNLFERCLHLLIEEMVIAKRNCVAVMNRQNWAFIDVGKFFNQLFRDLTVNIDEINPSS